MQQQTNEYQQKLQQQHQTENNLFSSTQQQLLPTAPLKTADSKQHQALLQHISRSPFQALSLSVLKSQWLLSS